MKTPATGTEPDEARGSSIPDQDFYRPVFAPWLGYGPFKEVFSKVQPHTLISADRCYVLYSLAIQASALVGQWYECGVYQGGSAMLLAHVLAAHRRDSAARLHLFDTFAGMPPPDPRTDRHRRGDFADCSLASVRARLEEAVPGIAVFHEGLIPETFVGLHDHQLAFAHIDVDIFRSVFACCEFIHPRLVMGGFMVFDDYGFSTCPGARRAVDEFFADKPEFPLVLPTGQAVVFKSS